LLFYAGFRACVTPLACFGTSNLPGNSQRQSHNLK
jgi:hypothetical protein